MAINRFSRGPIAADVQSEFIPLPLDVIDRQLERKQNSYDKTKDFLNIAKETVYGVKATSSDQEYLSNEVAGYEDAIDDAITGAGGDFSRLGSMADSLGNKIKKDIMTGKMGAVHNNFVKAQTQLGELSKLRTEGKIRESTYNRNVENISSFSGTEETDEGGYTSIANMAPPMFVEFGKVGDDYGRFVADQYRASGAKYIDKDIASKHIYENLWNNDDIVSNAKDELWQTYGDMEPAEENKLLQGYLMEIAQASGFKIAYEQRLELREGSNPNGGVPMTYDIQGGRPVSSAFNTTGSDIFKVVSDLKLDRVLAATPVSSTPGPFGGPPAKKSTSVTDDNKRQKTIETLFESDIIRDLAEAHGIDSSNPNLEKAVQLQEAIKAMDRSSVHTRVALDVNASTFESFKSVAAQGVMQYYSMEDMATGKELDSQERESVIQKFISLKAADRESGDGSLRYGGVVVEPGQAYPFGSTIVHINDSKSNQIRAISIDMNNLKRTASYAKDRQLAAFNVGASRYNLDGNIHQYLRVGDHVRHYINDQRVNYEDGSPVMYQPAQ